MAEKAGFIPQKNKNDLTSQFAKLVSGKRVSVAIDAANLYYASSVSKIKIDYFQVASWFLENCESVNLNFYTAFDPEDEKQMEFFEGLQSCGYKVTKKPIKVFEDSKKGNMDIELAVDAMLQLNTYDILILLSGDGDFTYLITALESLGKETIILGIGGFTSYELHQEAGRYFFLNRISHVWRKYNNKNNVEVEVETKNDISGEEGVLILTQNKPKKPSHENYTNHDNIPAKLEKTRKTGSDILDKAQNEVKEITTKPRRVEPKKVADIITEVEKVTSNINSKTQDLQKDKEQRKPALQNNTSRSQFSTKTNKDLKQNQQNETDTANKNRPTQPNQPKVKLKLAKTPRIERSVLSDESGPKIILE